MNNGKIQNQVANTTPAAVQKQSVNQLMNAFLDGEKMRYRFNELLGKRAPQFISGLISMVNADESLQKAFFDTPNSVIQSALKAAAFDLPIDQNLGYAYLVPFKDYKNNGRSVCNFILGWKGMLQLALRTGAYKTINVIDVREGELKSYNRLTEEIVIDFIEDDEAREAANVVGYVGYYKLVNGAEKTIYRTVKQIEAHEKKNRKGQYQGKGWKDDWDAMARKTIYRMLIGKYGVMSIEYQNQMQAEELADQMRDDNQRIAEFTVIDQVDESTGEVKEG